MIISPKHEQIKDLMDISVLYIRDGDYATAADRLRICADELEKLAEAKHQSAIQATKGK